MVYQRCNRQEKHFSAVKLTTISIVGAILSIIAAFVGSNVVAVFMVHVLGKGMSWYRHEWLPMVLYGPPAVAAILMVQYAMASLVKAEERPYFERATMGGMYVVYTISLLVMVSSFPLVSIHVTDLNFDCSSFQECDEHRLGLSYGSGRCNADSDVRSTALSIESLLLCLLTKGSFAHRTLINDMAFIGLDRIIDRRVHVSKRVAAPTYFIMSLVPAIVGSEGMCSFLDLFVPLTGRMGEISPVDNIIATITAALTFLSLPAVIPMAHRFGQKRLGSAILVTLALSAAMVAVFASPGWVPFDEWHPKRLFVHQVENVSGQMSRSRTLSRARSCFGPDLVISRRSLLVNGLW